MYSCYLTLVYVLQPSKMYSLAKWTRSDESLQTIFSACYLSCSPSAFICINYFTSIQTCFVSQHSTVSKACCVYSYLWVALTIVYHHCTLNYYEGSNIKAYMHCPYTLQNNGYCYLGPKNNVVVIYLKEDFIIFLL